MGFVGLHLKTAPGYKNIITYKKHTILYVQNVRKPDIALHLKHVIFSANFVIGGYNGLQPIYILLRYLTFPSCRSSINSLRQQIIHLYSNVSHSENSLKDTYLLLKVYFICHYVKYILLLID